MGKGVINTKRGKNMTKKSTKNIFKAKPRKAESFKRTGAKIKPPKKADVKRGGNALKDKVVKKKSRDHFFIHLVMHDTYNDPAYHNYSLIGSCLSAPAVKDLTHTIEGLNGNPKDAKKLVKVLRGLYKDYSMKELLNAAEDLKYYRQFNEDEK